MIVLAMVGGCGFAPHPSASTDGAAGDDAPPPPHDARPIDAPTCADTHVSCAGDVLQTCVLGQPELDRTCTWGCSSAGTPHCLALQPSGGGLQATDLADDPTLGVLSLGNATVNGDDGSISGIRAAGVGVISGIGYDVQNGVAIFRFAAVAIDHPLTLVGSTPIAFASLGTIDVNAIVDAAGGCASTVGGPGGGTGGATATAGTGTNGGAGGSGQSDNCSGGSGGGYGGTGGAGGHGGSTTSSFGDAPITMLVGGGGGGGGGASNGGAGGGGGGGFQLAANGAITIAATGGIDAGGCGGNHPGGGGSGGGGGGAGGSILVEAPVVHVAGALAVNGGGGGGADASNQNGSRGPLARMRASGGMPGGAQGGAMQNVNGGNGTSSNNNGGGGGGGVGRIRFDTRDGTVDLQIGAVLSPDFTDTPTTTTKATATTL